MSLRLRIRVLKLTPPDEHGARLSRSDGPDTLRLTIPDPGKLIIGAIFSDESKFAEALRRLEGPLGPPETTSERFSFDFTDYYAREMGTGLVRVFVCFENLLPLDELVRVKKLTLAVEQALEIRPGVRSVNLDPGYITASSLVLATRKGYSHRVYLGDGIHADVQLTFRKKRVESYPWTYPDYRTHAYQDFFTDVRAKYLKTLRAMGRHLGP